MADKRVLWVSTEVQGGISSYTRVMQETPLWAEWHVRRVVTHRAGSAAVKIEVFARGLLRFVVEIIRFRPSVIHLHAASDTSFLRKALLLWVSTPARVPVVLHMHGSRIQNYYATSPRVVRAVIRATLRRADTVVALGEVWASRLGEIAPGARIIQIPNAVRAARRAAPAGPDEPVHVVFLGKVGDHKGTFRLLEAWARLSRDTGMAAGPRNSAILTIAGDGEVDRARQQVHDLGIADTVEICDWLSESKVGELLDHAQVLVLPSRNEGQPMAVLEAMARGLCVIASDVGGIPEMIGGGCGVIVSPDDTEQITAALRRVIDDPEMRTHCGAAAFERAVRLYDIGTVWRQLDALYCEVSR